MTKKDPFILQAVVLADAAELRFRPMTIEKPRCLLPLVNMPLIEYTLEFLAVAGVQEIFVFCNAHADQVREYLAGSKWSNKNLRNFKIQTIYAPEAYSVGDVMRELDSKDLIQHDFILVSGNVISNMKFDQVLQEHRYLFGQRRESNKDALMTLVVKRATANHRSRAKGESAVIVLDPITAECIHYEHMPMAPQKRKIQVDTAHFKKHQVLQVHNDLLDCQIDICSPEVPALFTENFDYQDIRRDFVEGILNSDLYGKTIHIHVIGEEYAARVKSTQLYDSIARDIIQRWSFPMVPDSNIHEGHNYKYYRNHIYKEDNVTLAITSNIDRNVVIGSGTQVGENTWITNCTIGRNCVIGSNVVLDGAYIWDNVRIENGSSVRKSIIADNVHIKSNVHVTRGCLVSFNVVIGPNVSIPQFTKLTKVSPPDTSINTTCSQDIIGTEGEAFVWNMSWEDDDLEDEDNGSDNQKAFEIGFQPFDLSTARLTDFEFSESEADEDDDFESDGDELEKHRTEIEETVKRAIIEDHTVENALLELNALKMACNIHFRDLPPVIMPVIFSHVDASALPASGKKLVKWSQMIRKFSVSENDMMDCLTLTLNYCKSCQQGDRGLKLFKFALEVYWNCDVVDDVDVFKQWFKTTRWSLDLNEFKKICSGFIDKLDELESETDDEESTDEESE